MQPLTPEQFAARLSESHRTVWTIAASILNDAQAADDMVQEAVTIALRKLPEFDPATSFAAWFGQIVRFVSLNEARKRRRFTGTDQERMSQEPSPPPLPSPDTPFDARVQAALESLPEAARSCLLLRTLQGMSFAEIATALSMPEGTAMSHVHRARAVLRERLGSLSPRSAARGVAGGGAS